MMTFFENISKQFKGFYASLSPMKRMSVITSTFVILGAVIVVVVIMSGRSFTPLLTNIPAEQLPVIIGKLQEKQIPYKTEENGKTVSVPPEFLHSTQMMLMSETGSMKLGQMGFELFDKDNFGTTSYVQRINYQRALQGELMRTINSLDAVKTSKVILALPPKKTFLEEGELASASVVVDLKDGKTLGVDQVKGIIHLVASAVEGMDPQRVTVVDARGKVLSKNIAGASVSSSNEMMEFKLTRERELESRIEDILAKVVGMGKVTARVNAEVNFRQVSSVEEIVDPDRQAIRSIQTEEEKLRGNRSNTAGVPGARANLPGAEEPGTVGFRQDVDKELKTTNYENTKTVRNIKDAVGNIEKLSVAVLVDGVTTVVTNKEGVAEEKWAARSEEELVKYETIVKNAIGFDEKRGDTVKIENIKFTKEDFSESDRLLNAIERKKLVSYLIKWGVIALSFAFFFFVVVRPFMRWITESFQESVEDMLPKTIEELEDLQKVDNSLPGMSGALPMLEETIDPDKAESELLKERIITLVQADNLKATYALNQWLEERKAT
ncbi:MAG: flagellar M-ring protein FliF [Oligoflexia bacterium]|nr:flagellar M-ring protein FliF [Oligoflexia bacterium]